MKAIVGFAVFELLGLASWLLGRGAPVTDQAARASRLMAPVLVVGGFVYLVVTLLT